MVFRGRQLLQLARPHARQLAFIALLAIVATAFDLVEPLIYRYAINDIAGLFVEGGEVAESRKVPVSPSPPLTEEAVGDALIEHGAGVVAPRSMDQALETLLWGVALLLLVRVCGHGLQLAAEQRTATVGSRIESDVITRTFDHVVRMPLGFFSRRSSGALAKQIDQLDQVSPIVRAAVHELAPELLRVVGALAIMFTQSVRLSLAALVLLPPYVFVVYRSVSRLESGLNGYYGLWERVSARIQGVLGSIKTVKLAGAEAREARQLREQSAEAYASYLRRNRLANRYLFLQTTLNYTSQALVLGFGGFLVLRRQLTPGDVVMFVAYLDKLFGPVETLSATAVSLQEHLASLRRALRLLATGPPEAPGVALAPGPGTVEFQDVHFDYDPQRPVLEGLTFTATPGRVTAIVGPSGAGKTTAMDLLLKLYAPKSGRVVIDGQDVATLDPASLRAAVGVVAADGALFRGTLAENLRYQRADASDEEILAAAHAAGLEPLLGRLPDGLETEVGEGGTGLSVGERQRLQLARVLVARPRVLVLDEATANLDYATETQVRELLFGSHGDAASRTTLVIAHRWSMVEPADQVVVLDGGRVVAQGTPAEVRHSNEWFAGFAAVGAGANEGDAP